MTRAVAARQARGLVEASLDGVGWRRSRRSSFWFDVLVPVEERA